MRWCLHRLLNKIVLSSLCSSASDCVIAITHKGQGPLTDGIPPDVTDCASADTVHALFLVSLNNDVGESVQSATLKTASLSPPSPEVQRTPWSNSIPLSNLMTFNGSDSVDYPAAVGKLPDAAEPLPLSALGVVELELLPDELLPEPGPESEEEFSSPIPPVPELGPS